MRTFLLFVFLASGALLYTMGHSNAASAPNSDVCAGCSWNPAAEGSDSDWETGCEIVLWRTVSGLEEDCGDQGVDCNDAECTYSYLLRYKTIGACTGKSWTWGGRTWYPSTTPVTLQSGSYSSLCGVTGLPQDFTMVGDITPAITVSDGCQVCD